jgi:hypothetical protein
MELNQAMATPFPVGLYSSPQGAKKLDTHPPHWIHQGFPETFVPCHPGVRQDTSGGAQPCMPPPAPTVPPRRTPHQPALPASSAMLPGNLETGVRHHFSGAPPKTRLPPVQSGTQEDESYLMSDPRNGAASVPDLPGKPSSEPEVSTPTATLQGAPGVPEQRHAVTGDPEKQVSKPKTGSRLRPLGVASCSPGKRTFQRSPSQAIYLLGILPVQPVSSLRTVSSQSQHSEYLGFALPYSADHFKILLCSGHVPENVRRASLFTRGALLLSICSYRAGPCIMQAIKSHDMLYISRII